MRYAALALVVATALVTGACQKEADAPARGPLRVENETLGFAIADLPNECSLSQNQGSEIELLCGLDGASGVVTFELGAEERGVNLLEKAKAQKEWFLAQPGGEFFGNRELITPLGAGYTARGAYDEAGSRVEESRILSLHPDKDRALLVRYRYAEGTKEQTQKRLDHLLYIVGEIGALEAEPEATG